MLKPHLCVAISTVKKNLDNALEITKDLDSMNIETVIVVQGFAKESQSILNDGYCNKTLVIYSPTVGLSISRNIALENCSSDYIWFLDDDVIINQKRLRSLIKMDLTTYDVYIAKIFCSDDNAPYKNYDTSKNKKISRLDLLRCSSIEIIANVNFIKKNHIKFNTQYGLGAKYPTSEENLFLLDIFDSRGRFNKLDVFLVYHPCNEDKRSPIELWHKVGYGEAKAHVAARYGFFLGGMLIIRWGFRALINGVQFRVVKNSFKEFLRKM